EWEDRGMVWALADHLNNGWLQLICVDSVDAESWYAAWAHPSGRAIRHAQYDSYLLHEVMPLSWQINQNPFLMTTGASFGAYHAASFAFRYPHLVGRMIGMAGMYDIRRFTGGYSDETVYFHNPAEFLVHEHDPWRLHALQRMDIIITTGHDDQMRDQSEHLSSLLWSKGIWNALRIWDGWAHDWPWWQQMFRLYVGGSD
ncbi:MAG: esterase family protein, partial [Vicinamibacterales bacterium]